MSVEVFIGTYLNSIRVVKVSLFLVTNKVYDTIRDKGPRDDIVIVELT